MAKVQGAQSPLVKIAILGVLLAALLGVLVYFNILSCGSVHVSACDVYYSAVAGGKPKILIVHGDEGIGDPRLLEQVLSSPRFGARVSAKHLDVVSLPNLMDNQLVIVEKAREMDVQDIKMFQDYVNRGGRLVWIGDAGSAAQKQTGPNYFLKYSERKSGGSDEYIGPWARKSGDKQVSLDYLLGVDFRATYCSLKECRDGELVGHFDIVNADKKLVYGLSQGLAMYGDFAIVVPNESAYHSTLAYLNYGIALTATPPEEYFWLSGEKTDFGKEFPLIVSSGIGGRVSYYAFAPEYFVSEKMPLDERGKRIEYWGIIENLYYGILYK